MTITDIKELLGDDVGDMEIKIMVSYTDETGKTIEDELDVINVEEEDGELRIFTY